MDLCTLRVSGISRLTSSPIFSGNQGKKQERRARDQEVRATAAESETTLEGPKASRAEEKQRR